MSDKNEEGRRNRTVVTPSFSTYTFLVSQLLDGSVDGLLGGPDLTRRSARSSFPKIGLTFLKALC